MRAHDFMAIFVAAVVFIVFGAIVTLAMHHPRVTTGNMSDHTAIVMRL